MTYLLQVSTCWIIFFGIFLLFLRKETFFSINRYYLLGALTIGLFIPFLGGLLPANEASIEVYQVMTQFTTVEIEPQHVAAKSQPFDWMLVLWAIYALGSMVVLSRFLYGLYRIFSIYHTASTTKHTNYTLVESNTYHLPFSFFHFIFISKQLPLNDEVEKVLKHEELHASQWHSIDIVFTELLQVFFWFNPILIFYKNALRQSHEYLADAYVTQDYNKNSYGQLLLLQSTGGLEVALANHFFHSQIKKRITMMYKEKSKRSAMVKYLAAVPVLIAMLIIFSSNQVEDPNTEQITESTVDFTAQENFDGRKIIQRNWQELYGKYKSVEGKISIKAEANANGDIVYAEIINQETTIDNKAILKDALKAAKGYKIEKGSGTSVGKIILNLGKRQPNQMFSFYKNEQEFQWDKNINIGLEVPKGSVKVTVEGNLLKEDEDYTINYSKGNLEITNAEYIGQPVNVQFEDVQGDPIFKVVEEMPRFPGCENMDAPSKEKEDCAKQKMLDFIYSNLKYPAKARNAEVEGMVVIQFIVEKDGSITGSKILRNIGDGCGEESQRVVNSMPTWIPGKQKGKAVRVKYTLPVKFKLEDKKTDALMPVVVGHGESNEKNKKENITQNPLSEKFADPTVYKVVEEMPRFPGCEDSAETKEEKSECAQHEMLKYIYTNIKYPAKARNLGIEGIAVVQFIINTDGSISDATAVRNPGGGLGEEAKRVIELMPKWQPGKQQGKKVKVQYTLPVKFKLQGDDKEEEPKIKNTLTIKESKFHEIEDVTTILNLAGLSKKCEVEKYRMVYVPYEKDVHVHPSSKAIFSPEMRKFAQMASNKDKYFIEDVHCQCPGDEASKYYGSFTIKIVGDDINSPLEGKVAGVNIKKEVTENIRLSSPNAEQQQPLFVIDGKIKPKSKMESINPDDIKAIRVVKGDKALEKYGERGANGVIEIDMKPRSERTSYIIEGQMFDYGFYSTIDKNHIKSEEPASKEYKFMRGIEGNLIKVRLLEGYGFNSAYFPNTNTEEGSKQALLNYVANNIKYPKSAIDNAIEGLVTVRYTVEADGDLTNFKIGRSVGWGLDEAVITMMEQLADEKGLWTPAYIDRRSIATTMTLPVKFKMQDDQKVEARSRKMDIKMLDISPNPSDGRFNISFELEDIAPVDIYFYSISGQLIKEIKGVSNTYKNSVDLSNNKGQTVLVNIIQNGKIHTNKVIIN